MIDSYLNSAVCYRKVEKISNLNLTILFFFIFILLQSYLEYLARDSSWILVMSYLDEICIFLLFSYMVLSYKISIRDIITDKVSLLFLIFTLLGIVSSIVNGVAPIIMASQMILYAKGFLFYYICSNLRFTERQLNYYLRYLIIVSITIVFFSLLQFKFPKYFGDILMQLDTNDVRGGINSVKSIFVHSGQLGWFSSFIGLYFFAHFLFFRNGLHLMIFVLVSFSCLISTRVKAIAAMFFSCFCGSLVYLKLSNISLRAKRIMPIFYLIMLLGLIPLSTRIIQIFESKIGFTINTYLSQPTTRTLLYITSGEIARDFFPLGAGLGRFGSYTSSKYYSPVYYQYGLSEIQGLTKDNPEFMCDTFWPMVLGEVGVLGFVVYMLIIVFFIYQLYKCTKSSTSRTIQFFCFGTLLVLIESLIESLAMPVYSTGPFVYYVFGAVGLCFALEKSELNESTINK